MTSAARNAKWVLGLLVGATTVAQAQLLDFDSVCPSPPCAVGSLYAPSGVTFSPTAAQIVAGGTGGLTGVVGGPHYLLVGATGQLAITLARPATFYAIKLSRAAAASSPVTVRASILKAGQEIGAANVTLNEVGTWFELAWTNSEFDTILLQATGSGDLSFGIDVLQLGGTCGGFADVQASDLFCDAAEWLANRGVTLGCGPGQFCPSQSVTRAQMALFMQRLGEALTPARVVRAASVNNGVFLTREYLCQTAPFMVVGGDRTAVVHGYLNMSNPSAPITLSATLAYSLNGGASWHGLSTGGRASVEPGNAESVSDGGIVDLAAGRSYRFALEVLQTGGGPGVIDTDVSCRLFAQIGNAQ